MSGWQAVRIDELEAIPWPGAKTTWRPLRHAVGARIVGMGAYTAEEAGQDVVEPHRESTGGMGHHEVYIVVRGRATFTLDGEEVDAPAGTVVRVDPQVHRHAVAAEPRTAVVALGGEPTYEPSSSEWIERARPYIRSDPARARTIVDDLRAQRPDSPGVPIAEALLAIGRGDREAASEALRAVPQYHDRLRDDPDLGGLVSPSGPGC
jgi:mannose-6-phosphate isomerase-like protein (cupin superfamily)